MADPTLQQWNDELDKLLDEKLSRKGRIDLAEELEQERKLKQVNNEYTGRCEFCGALPGEEHGSKLINNLVVQCPSALI